MLNFGNKDEQYNLVDHCSRIKTRARRGDSLVELKYLWLIMSYKGNLRERSEVISHQSLPNSPLFPLPSGPTPPPNITADFFISSVNSPSINLTFVLYASRDIAKAKDCGQFRGEGLINRWCPDKGVTGDRIIPPFPTAVRDHYKSAELKTAQDSTRSDLDNGVVIALRRRTTLRTMGHIKDIYNEGQLIPFSGKRGERREVFHVLWFGEQSCLYVCMCIFLEGEYNCHQNLSGCQNHPFPLPHTK